LAAVIEVRILVVLSAGELGECQVILISSLIYFLFSPILFSFPGIYYAIACGILFSLFFFGFCPGSDEEAPIAFDFSELKKAYLLAFVKPPFLCTSYRHSVQLRPN